MCEKVEQLPGGYCYDLFGLLVLFCFVFNPAGVSPLAVVLDKGVACSTGMPSEGHLPRPEVGWVELWDQHTNNLKNQGSQIRIQYLAKGRSYKQWRGVMNAVMLN
jgi:hypothetical protein